MPASREALVPACAQTDGRINVVASALAHRELREAGSADLVELEFLLRAQGIPHVWPRLLVGAAEGPDEDPLRAHLASWFGEVAQAESSLLCGWGVQHQEGRQVGVAIALAPLAGLQALPTRVERGQRLELSVAPRAPATSPKVTLLGPRGRPVSPLVSRHGDGFVSSFHLDLDGLWRVQVSMDFGEGPRPVLESWVSVGQPPPPSPPKPEPAPGESREPELEEGSASARARLFQMVNDARSSERLPPLRRSHRLDQLAQQHAEAMKRHGRAAHDLGAGGPAQRVQAAGIEVLQVGENLAQAATLSRAHRLLWSSPSHRSTLLHRGFQQVGLGIARESAKHTDRRRAPPTLWVVELFVATDTVLIP